MEILLKYGIFACFLSLIFTSVGWPIPEELNLLAIGALVSQDAAHWSVGLLVGYLGVTIGDVIAWTMGRRVGLEPKGFVSRMIGEEQIRDIEQFYRKWGDWAIVIARQIPASRFPTFFFAGASAVPLGRFCLIDGLAAIITANLYFWLGFAFADDLSRVSDFIKEFRFYTGVIIVTLVVFVVGLLFWKHLKKKK